MEDFLLSVAAKIAEYIVGPILHHSQYLCCFNNFVGSLPAGKEELELTRDNIKERVREATNRTEKIEPPVEKWLKDVEEVLEEVKMLEGRILEVRKSYFRGKCQYSLAKEIARITKKMTQLKDNSKFEPFSRISQLPSMQYYSSKDFVFFESTKSAYDNLLETLKDKSVRMIGLVGMGGSGKTTLVKEVAKKAEELKLFDKVVMATVSQTPNIKSIQAEIADQLGVEFHEESEDGRARRLSQILKKGTTLLILDDVWGKINFEALGIPFHENKGCALLLTTREREVCSSMQCQSIIELEPFSRISELPSMQYYSSKDFVFFESTKSAYDNLLETLKDKSVRMIGLVGMGGSGKTTLVKEVGKKAEELKLFEKVVIATVSQTPNIKSIQAEIADQLGVKFPEESEEGRARRLSQRLKEGTTLLILDDVWGKINFEALGIPFDENEGCGVLLTTRQREVCSSMKCQSIELNLLTDKEAWRLFASYANINDDTPNVLKVVARKIVNECKGLPIAIVTVGSTLKDKSFERWKLALSRLEDSKPLDVLEGLRSPHVCLKLSYDNLTNELAKSLLILCSMFPEDHEIDLEDLFRFGKGWCLSGTFGTMETARMEMHVAVDILRDSCLLLRAKKKKVKMQDMVRDLALWIATERGQAILARTPMDPRMLVDDENIPGKRAISLWGLNDGQFLDEQLNCPSLEILLLHSPKVGFEVSNVFLERLEMLKILAFLRFESFDYGFSYIHPPTHFSLSLPKSIELLKNLHTLCLRGYKLGDISLLEGLQALEILDLRGSSFEELPNGIAAFKRLKLLDLFYCSIAKSNVYEVIEKCLQLEELYLHLYRSEQGFPNNVCLPPRLKRYVIIHDRSSNSYYIHTLEMHKPSRAFGIEGSPQSFISLPIQIKDLFLKSAYLYLKYLGGGYKNVIPSVDPRGMNELIVLILESCPEIECLFDSTIRNVDMLQAQVVFCSLDTLGLYHMNSLQEVFHDTSSSSRCSLQNLQEIIIKSCDKLYSISFPRNSKLFSLKELRISSCPMLTCLFMPSIAQTLVLLESLRISYCSELKNVIEEVKEGDVDYASSESHTFSLLPKLRFLRILDCNKMEYIFPLCFAQRLVSLEKLIVGNNREMKYVFGTEKEYQSQHETKIDINLLKLADLTLWSLPNLVGIWPDYCRPRLPNLREIDCRDCSRLSDLFVHAAGNHSDPQQDISTMEHQILCVVATTSNQLKDIPRFNELKLKNVGLKGIFEFQIGESNTQIHPFNLDLSSLWLQNLPELNFIWMGPTNFLCLQMLQSIRVEQCQKLTTIFSPTIVRSLPMLKRLDILDCEEVEQIFDSSDAQQLNSLYTCSQQVCFPKLESIQVERCNKLKYLFYNFADGHFPNLTNLHIEECSQLEKVFAFEREADDGGQEGRGQNEEQVLLEELTYIRLISLPNFEEIHPRFELKDHVQQFIEDCPKYSTNLYLHSDGSDQSDS